MSRRPAEALEGAHTRATCAARELRMSSWNRDAVSLHDDGGPLPDAVDRMPRTG